MTPAAGTLVTRNVKLLEPLGKGGMGSVWVAEHTTLETEVAVKFIAPEHAEKKRFVARFRREASSAAKIKSPHVVQVFDHGITTEGVPYIVMELLDGEPLSRRLRRATLSPREASMLVAQVTKVLTIAHDLGIVHRDLKPDNLFLVESGYELFVKVLDFGIAKQLTTDLNEITDTGAMVGTPYYMSPEMLLSPKDADHRADLWALSVVAYHALTGELPFRGETIAALSVAVNDGQFAPPSSRADHLGSELDVFFKLALCRNIDGRFQTASELAQAFRKALLDANALSGDRTSAPVDADVLPETARPVAVERSAATATSEAAADTAVRDTEADATVTSEQLAKIRSGRDDVSVDDDTLEAPMAAAPSSSTLEGTATSNDAPRGVWGRRAGLLAVAMALIGIVVWMQRGEAPPVTAASTSAPSPPPTPPPEPVVSAAPRPVPVPPAISVTSASASASATARRPPKRPPAPVIRPRPKPAPAPKPAEKCANPFTVDENGDLQPRPECF